MEGFCGKRKLVNQVYERQNLIFMLLNVFLNKYIFYLPADFKFTLLMIATFIFE
jgi:hypothetical protein